MLYYKTVIKNRKRDYLMIKVLFVCHGNICRSPMAEFVFKDMVKKAGRADEFIIASAATSTEEIGNPVHPGTKRKLASVGISCDGKCAVQLKKSDYTEYDLFVCMDSNNVRNALRIFGGDSENKVCKMMDFTCRKGDVADPWYSDRFDVAFSDIYDGCVGLMESINN